MTVVSFWRLLFGHKKICFGAPPEMCHLPEEFLHPVRKVETKSAIVYNI